MGLPEVIRTPEEEISEKIQLVEIKSNGCFDRYTKEFEYLYRSETDVTIKEEYSAIISYLKACKYHSNKVINKLNQLQSELK